MSKRNEKEALNPDNSSEILLDKMRKSIKASDPLMAAITDEEVEAFKETFGEKSEEGKEPESAEDISSLASRRRIAQEQILAWNDMAEQMIKVVKTIKVNEEKTLGSEKRNQRVSWFVVGVMCVSIAGNIHVTLNARAQTEALNAEMTAANARSAANQNRMLEAVASLAEAQALLIKAEAEYDPEAKREAGVKALEAREKALVAKKETVPSHEKPEVQKKIDEAKVDVAEAKKEDAEVPPPHDAREEFDEDF